MKIYYIVNSRIPTEKAHGYQISKMCEEFGKAGAEVELWLPNRENPISKDLFSFYSLERNFNVRYIKCFDVIKYSYFLGKLAFLIQELFFIFAARNISIESDSIVYSRDPLVIFYYLRRDYRTVYDAHKFPQHNIRIFLKLISGASKIIANSFGTASEFRKRGFEQVLIAPNGVDLEKFDFNKDKSSLRKELDLPRNSKIAMYVGHLYSWKGIDIILEAADYLRQQLDLEFILVGGTSDDIKKYKNVSESLGLSNITFLGYQEKDKIPFYMKAADVLLLTNIPITKESEFYTSPIKMFEYMASGTSIIASDLPSVKEVLDAETAYMFKAGDSLALSNAIRESLSNHPENSRRSKNAKEKVKKFSWGNRARSILEFITN
jgi:glycosyltransferase involved in cell wall biosynthesis